MSTSSEFVVLGCGHSEAIDNYNNNGMIKTRKGNVLIDAGHTIKYALRDQGLSIRDIDAVFITHVHGDHVFGLERIAYETLFKYQHRVKLYLHESIYDELWHSTLKGSMGKHGDGEATLEDYFDVYPIVGNSLNILGHHLELFQNRHTPDKPSFGINIDDKVFFSGDTTAIPDIVTEMNYAVGFHDVTLSKFNPVHATLSSLIELYPAEIKKKLYLMSYEDHWPDFLDLVNQEFLGFARQGMRISLD